MNTSNASLPADLFVSYTSADFVRCVKPLCDELAALGVRCHRVASDETWGQNFVSSINDSLLQCRHVLLCLSASYVDRPWTEVEWTAAFSSDVRDGKARVLPLILDDGVVVKARLPLLNPVTCWRLDGAHDTALRIARFLGYAVPEDAPPVRDAAGSAGATATMGATNGTEPGRTAQDSMGANGQLAVRVLSMESGRSLIVRAEPLASLRWLVVKACEQAGLITEARLGALRPMGVRWVLVDQRVEPRWKKMATARRQRLYGLFQVNGQVVACSDDDASLASLGLEDDTDYHLHAVPDAAHDVHFAEPARRSMVGLRQRTRIR